MAEQKLIEHNHMEESCFRPKPCPRCNLNEIAPDLLTGVKVGLRFTKNTATADAVSITKGDCDDAKTAVKCLQTLIAKAEKAE